MLPGNIRIRRCDKEADADAIHDLVTELAIFERSPESVKTTADDFRRDGFRTDNPLFFAALAEEIEDSKWKPVGLLLCYFKYSTWEGKCIHMEDLFVLPSHRRKGIATKLFSHCVDAARQNECRRIEWNVLDWNEGAKKFYKSVGAEIPDAGAWELMRFDSCAIAKFALGQNL